MPVAFDRAEGRETLTLKHWPVGVLATLGISSDDRSHRVGCCRPGLSESSLAELAAKRRIAQ